LKNKKEKALSFIIRFNKEMTIINKELKLTTVYIEKNYNYEEFFEKIL